MLKANIGLEMVSSYQDLEDYMGRKLSETTIKEFDRQAGILGNTVGDNKKYAQQIVNGSFHHAKWSDRIWSNQQSLKLRLYDTLQSGLIQGKNPRDLARDIMKSMGASRNDAERLMRTEMCRVQTDAQMTSMEVNGFDEYEFIAEHGPRTCEQCLAMDGKHFKIRKAIPGENAPPLHPNCRCSTAAWMDDKAYEEWLHAMAAGETNLGFEEWGGHRTISKSITLDEMLKENVSKGGPINEDVLRSINDILKSQKASNHFGNIRIEDLGRSKVFDTVFTQNGTWYDTDLVLNSKTLGNKTIEQIDRMFLGSPNTVCNSLKDGIIHEIYHAKMALMANANEIDRLDNTPGIGEVSRYASKDMLETISEIGVLKEKGDYDKVNKNARSEFEKYFGGD